MDGLKLSKQATLVWGLIGLMFLLAGVSSPKRSLQDVRRACFAYHVDMCGDLLCESSDDSPESILKQMHIKLEECIDNPDSISERYYNEDEQKRILN